MSAGGGAASPAVSDTVPPGSPPPSGAPGGSGAGVVVLAAGSFTYATSIFFSASAFAASLAVVPAFSVPFAPAWLAVSAAAAAAVGAPLSRLPRRHAFAGSVLALACLLGALGAANQAAVWRWLLLGPDRLMTETLPLGGARVELSAALAAVWVCTGAAVDSAARCARSREPVPPRAYAWPLGLFVACFAAASGAPAAGDWARLGASALVTSLAGAAVVAQLGASRLSAAKGPPPQGEGPSALRPLDFGPAARLEARGARFRSRSAAGVLGAAGVAAASLALPGWGNPLVLHRRLPTSEPLVTDPLAEMATLRSAAERVVLTWTTSEASSGYLPVAVLDSYDGSSWRFAATFEPIGGLVPPRPAPPRGAIVTQRVVIDRRLPVPLLPAADRPVAVSGMAVSADASTGMLIAQAPSRVERYTVISEAPLATLLDLVPTASVALRAGPSSPTVPPGSEGLPPGTAPDVAAAVDYVSLLSGSRPAPTMGFLQRALEALRSNGTTLAGPPPPGSGTSLSDVIEAVTVRRSATPEQYATFYALVVRWLGLPARVATGFRIGGGGGARPGTHRVTGRDAWAWVEIPVRATGWVVADPSPAPASAAEPPPPESVRAAPPTTLEAQPELLPRRQAVGRALAPPGRIALPGARRSAWWPLLAVAGGGVAAAILALPVQAAWRRASCRRRRLRGDPRRRAVGAWLELLDTLHRAGLRPSPAATAAEVAAETGHHFGPEAVEAVAGVGLVAEAALFSSAAVSESSAVEAWAKLAWLRSWLVAGLDLRARLGWLVTVGPSQRRRRLRSRAARSVSGAASG